MNKKTVIALTSLMLIMSGCGSHSRKKADSEKTSVGTKTLQSTRPENSATPSQTSSPETDREITSQTPVPTAKSNPSGNTSTDISGDYLIISYDNGSGVKETFDPGNDDSIIGSSSIALNNDGSCQFNMPGIGENTGCSWSENTIQAGGSSTTFNISGNEMTIQENGETYVFEKSK